MDTSSVGLELPVVEASVGLELPVVDTALLEKNATTDNDGFAVPTAVAPRKKKGLDEDDLLEDDEDSDDEEDEVCIQCSACKASFDKPPCR